MKKLLVVAALIFIFGTFSAEACTADGPGVTSCTPCPGASVNRDYCFGNRKKVTVAYCMESTGIDFQSTHVYVDETSAAGKEYQKMAEENFAGLKKKYPAGTRILLISMDDPFPVPAGTKGTVTGIDLIGQISMKWDNGYELSIMPGIDTFEVITN